MALPREFVDWTQGRVVKSVWNRLFEKIKRQCIRDLLDTQHPHFGSREERKRRSRHLTS